MTSFQSVQQHPASVDAYIRSGWSLVPIPAGTKGPKTNGWNLRESALKSQADLPDGYGIGLAHAYSGTMALDIDSWDVAEELLSQNGINLNKIYNANDAVVISSGKQGHGKLLYKMPFGLTLPSKKITKFGVTVYELRCATSNGLTVQDVLPPSIHPETAQPYRWAGLGNWTRLPVIPTELLEVWLNLLQIEKIKNIPTGGKISTSWEEILEAVESIPPDCSREEWISVGMALNWAGFNTGRLADSFLIWKDWSSEGVKKYPGEKELFKQWDSFKTDKKNSITIGTLFHIAGRYGWHKKVPDVSSLFTNIATPKEISLSLKPPAPEIDLSVFPKILSNRSIEVSESVGCDPLVPLFSGLAAVCGVIDARSRLELMPGYKVPPVLWLMTLGDPADKKSPGSRPMLSPLKTIEIEDRPRYGKELLEWESKEAAYASAKKAFLEFAASNDALLGAQAPTVPPLPDKPVSLKITVSDITSQKLVRNAAERPRGLLCYLDEMNSWVKKLTDKASGEDRSAWVVSYEAEGYEMDRVGAGSIYADNMAISIYGNIQPQVFRNNIENLASDGLLQRFIPAILRGDKTKLGNPVVEELTSATEWENTLRTIYSLPAQVYRLSNEAYKEFRNFQEWYESSKTDERLLMSGQVFMTAFGKLEGTVGRLILLFHVIENPFSNVVNADVVQRVVRFARTYIIPAYRYCLGEIGGISTFDQWVADHIIHYCDKEFIKLIDIKRSARRQVTDKSAWAIDQMIIGAMQNLEEAGWVLRIDDGMREHQHHAEWAINPKIMESFAVYRKEVILAKQRRKEDIYKLSPNKINPVHGYSHE